jgi:hypothetical protein
MIYAGCFRRVTPRQTGDPLVLRGHRAGYLLRYPADLGQPGQGGPRHNLADVVQRHDQFFDSVL